MKVWLAPVIGLVLASAPLAAMAASPAAGEWRGAIQTPDGDLPVIVRLVEEKDALTGGLVAPGQSPDVIALKVTETTASRLSFTAPSIGGAFSGVWRDDQKAWSGTWTQSGLELPLVLRRAP